MVAKYDFVVTSGGIGPTHDGVYSSPNNLPSELIHVLDITYQSLAKSFNQPLAHHLPTIERMREFYEHRPWTALVNEDQRTANKRMALFPEKAEVLYTGKDLWVVCILDFICFYHSHLV
jgi:molybdopterin-biosynthesis enzyme MoeA-like protein